MGHFDDKAADNCKEGHDSPGPGIIVLIDNVQ